MLTARFAVTATLIVCLVEDGASGQEVGAGMVGRLRVREREFDRVKVEFDWLAVTAPLDSDAFDRTNWLRNDKPAYMYHYRMWLLRPHFRLRREASTAGKEHTVFTWIDGKRLGRALHEDGHWSVYINDSRWSIHGTVPLLTPFEMQVCDVHASLLELVEAGALHVVSDAGGELVLAGDAGPAGFPLWNVWARLDRQRGLLPVEQRAEITFANGKQIKWTVRTLDSAPFGDIHVITEAIFALDTPVDREHWQIYHYKVTKLARDDTLTRATLAVRIPDKNVKLVDDTTGLVRFVNKRGVVTLEKHRTPQEIKEAQRAIARSIEANREKREVLARRQRAFYGIALGAGALAAVVTGLWIWRQRTLRLA